MQKPLAFDDRAPTLMKISLLLQELTKLPDHETQSAEVLKVCQLLDLSEEAGRRHLSNTLRELVADETLVNSNRKLVMVMLRRLFPSEAVRSRCVEYLRVQTCIHH
jgi:hypothetical protein